MIPGHDEPTISRIAAEYAHASMPWYVGYSGGKDSSAVLKLIFLALARLSRKSVPITVVYADTGVQIPPARELALSSLTAYEAECAAHGVPLSVAVVSPQLRDRYLVKVIGRGYPPPTNKFRWCTRRLLTDPVNRFFRGSFSGGGLLLLGVRRGESAARRQTIARHCSGDHEYLQQDREKGLAIYAPIVRYSTEEVWSTLLDNSVPRSIDGETLLALYEQGSGRSRTSDGPRSAPMIGGRFGCWTCTVVRRDHTLAALVSNGCRALGPLLEFRDWLALMRHDPQYRCERRRNGAPGPGPLTLRARSVALERLICAEQESGIELLTADEVSLIGRLWEEDINSPAYREG
jgi:DNA sulfur modification protein DndC